MCFVYLNGGRINMNSINLYGTDSNKIKSCLQDLTSNMDRRGTLWQCQNSSIKEVQYGYTYERSFGMA